MISSRCFQSLSSLLLVLPSALAFTPCPLLGPAFPPFTLDPSSKDIKASLAELTSEFDNLLKAGNGSHGEVSPNTTTFSLALFSTNEGPASEEPFFFEYHYTAPSLKASPGFRPADKDSVYRAGGLTQIFTVWSVLIEAGDGIWNEPVTEYLPELVDAVGGDAKVDPIRWVDWEDVTVGQLASHMAGLDRDSCVGDEKDIVSGHGLPSSGGLPLCSSLSKSDSLALIANQAPIAPPGTTPIYSNVGFQVLGFVVEKITGQPFSDVLRDDILDPLSLDSTTLSPPRNSTTGIIPVNKKASGWDTQYGTNSPATSLFTSITDLSLAGKAILNSTLLSHPQTNRWLKPTSHTSNPANSLGYPWIIYSGGAYPNTSMVDIYTFTSEIGLYTSYLGLVPDYNVGFAILAADTVSAPDLNAHADIIGDVVLETLITAATKQADTHFGGTYSSPANQTTTTNSTLKITSDKLPGLYITDLTLNNKNHLSTLAHLTSISNPSNLSIRLYPTGLRKRTPSGGAKISFRAVLQDKTELADNGTPTCVSWMDVGVLRGAGGALDEFVFEVDGKGRALGVEVEGVGVGLGRVV